MIATPAHTFRPEVFRAMIDADPESPEYDLAHEQATATEILAAKMVLRARMRAQNIERVERMATVRP